MNGGLLRLKRETNCTTKRENEINTVFLLVERHNAMPIIPIERVCADYFSSLKVNNLLRKIAAGEIVLPLTRMENSERSAKGVHIQDLADYIDKRRAATVKECEQLCGVRLA